MLQLPNGIAFPVAFLKEYEAEFRGKLEKTKGPWKQ